MKKTLFTLFYFSIFILLACKHDGLTIDLYHHYSIPNKIPEPKDVKCRCITSCYEVPPHWDTVKFHYNYVCFNNGNPYQIAYLRGKPGILPQDLWTFDFETGVSKMITTNVAYGLSWSNNGWFAFTGIDRQIYKIKANGDSLTKLTNRNYYCNYPLWNFDGNQIVFSTDATGSLHFIDPNGIEQDTIQQLSGFFRYRWIDSNTIVESDYDGAILLIDVRNKRRNVVRNRPDSTQYMADVYGGSIQKREVYWTMNIKAHYMKTNLDTKIATIIAESKQNNFLTTQANYAPQTDKLIQIRNVYDFFTSDTIQNLSPCLRKRVNYITIMNSDGSDERKILLPQ